MHVPACKESSSWAEPLSKFRTSSARKSQKSERQKNLAEVSGKNGGQYGEGDEGERNRESSTAPAACARKLLWRR
eukprot:122578-Pleurochrysis_carterae.AAC.4